ncbi:DedA family protein [Specibacter sp. AOP5-B1-6]|uniref:DedA family protein n=1 Tax=Specibacter sp. AOP5-B1-6 TaxID=3457653 RepID=UPI00402BEEEC
MIEHSAAQWWVIPMVSLFCLIDGFFLFLPSETAIVALASISARTGEPNIWLLIIGASIGAVIGDNIAYFMGRTLGTTRFKWMRRPRGAKAFAWAGRELEKRGAILIFTARYIPVGRIAVNFTAGATHFPWRRFVLLDGIAVVTWAGYSVAVGTFAGAWVHDNPLLGVGIAIAFAIAIGFVVDHAMKYLHHYLEKRGKLAPRPEPGLMAAQHAARVQAEAAPLAAATEAAAGSDGTGNDGTGNYGTGNSGAGSDEADSHGSSGTESTSGDNLVGAAGAAGAATATAADVATAGAPAHATAGSEASAAPMANVAEAPGGGSDVEGSSAIPTPNAGALPATQAQTSCDGHRPGAVRTGAAGAVGQHG